MLTSRSLSEAVIWRWWIILTRHSWRILFSLLLEEYIFRYVRKCLNEIASETSLFQHFLQWTHRGNSLIRRQVDKLWATCGKPGIAMTGRCEALVRVRGRKPVPGWNPFSKRSGPYSSQGDFLCVDLIFLRWTRGNEVGGCVLCVVHE